MSIWKVCFTFAASNFQKLNTMNKNYLFPRRFRVIGWVLAIAAVAAFFLLKNWFFKMPALYYDAFFEDEAEKGFFQMARSGILTLAMPVFTIGLLFIGFSKEKVEDEFVGHIREQSLVWATYVTAALFILATLFIAGVAYTYVPYLVFFVFLILFIVKFRIELHSFNKGGDR